MSGAKSNASPPQIGAGLGDYEDFRNRMRESIPRVEIVRPDGAAYGRPLVALSTTSAADPTLALVDAVAAMADIVSFYEDRVLNEGYLPYALDSASLALFARGLGQAPAMFVGAGVDLAMFAGPGRDVVVPKGASIQASLARDAAAPAAEGASAPAARPVAAPLTAVFETARALVARPGLNRLTALLTGPARLVPQASDLFLAGTGLGLAPGDSLLLVRVPLPAADDMAHRRKQPSHWMRMTILTVREDAALRATTVTVRIPAPRAGDSNQGLAALWTEAGNADLPVDAADGLMLYALDLTCRLFGYNAGDWATQPYTVQRAATPPGQPVGAYTNWPGFDVDPDAFDLQAVYARLVPGSRMLVEMPATRLLSTVVSVGREQVARFGMSGQATRVVLGSPGGIQPEPTTQGDGTSPSEADPVLPPVITVPGPILPAYEAPDGLLSTWLADGTVLIVATCAPLLGPPSDDHTQAVSATASSETADVTFAWIYDPRTALSTETGTPAQWRLGASLTLLSNGTVLLAGGLQRVADGYISLPSAEIYDPRSRRFRTITLKMCRARWGHTATAMPDGTVLLAGGLDAHGSGRATAEWFDPARQAFTLVETRLPRPTGLHAATLLADGNVLITGGLESAQADVPAQSFTGVLKQAVIYDAGVKAFGEIEAMGTRRVLHTATSRPDGTVLIAGGLGTGDPARLASTEIYDLRTRAFSPGPDLISGRASHGAACIPGGVLVIGGALSPSYEMIPNAATTPPPEQLPLPFPLPFAGTPRVLPGASLLARRAEPIPIGPFGIVAFGAGRGALPGARFLREPAPPSADARRTALVYAQSRPLALARPLDTQPIQGDRIALDGRIEGLAPGRAVMIAGRPPLARTTGPVRILGAGTLPAGTLLAVTAEIAVPDDRLGVRRWQVATPDAARLTIETVVGAGLRFMAGTGGSIGDVTPAEQKGVARIALCERADIRSLAFDAEAGATRLILEDRLANLYDRTTLTLYGNVVSATEGRSVVGEVLGSGNGQLAFQTFTLKLAPLAVLPDPAEMFAPALKVYVDGLRWSRVLALAACDANARVYQLALDVHGRARIQFGDGRNGQRLSTGRENVTADYRVGAGAAGNVAAGSLTRAPARVSGIKTVLNPLPAAGGLDAGTRADLRISIPAAARRTGRIVSQADITTFVRADPAVFAATLTSVGWTSLVTIAGPGNTVPDLESTAFRDLRVALHRAMAAPLSVVLLPCVSVPFKLGASATLRPGRHASGVRLAMVDAVRAAYAAPAMAFGRPVRASDLARLLGSVSGVEGPVSVTKLLVPGSFGPIDAAILPARPARGDPAAGSPYEGADILCLSPDSDAVAIDFFESAP